MEKLLVEIGFSKEDIEEYTKYKELDGDRIVALAKKFMDGGIEYEEAVEKAHAADMHEYTADLLFVLECALHMREKYAETGLPDEMYIAAMHDIKCKLDECKTAKGIFGTFVVGWFQGFFNAEGRKAFGRLQFDPGSYNREPVTIKGYDINEGDFCLACHIPSGGPLKPEMCMDSFKQAYEFFKDKLKDDVLVITCASWMLNPKYLDTVFPEDSNTAKFAKYFELVEPYSYNIFHECWRVFGKEYDGNPENLDTDTSMRRRFVEYIKSNTDDPEPFGGAVGIILFDGEKVLTQRM